jgi:2-iminobutanoate/2-iminopropanoate deaminase
LRFLRAKNKEQRIKSKELRMKKIINTSNAPAAIGPYSQAVEANGMLFISGQLPVNPAAGKIETTTAIAQTEQVFANIKAILDEAGYTFSDVVKSTVFLSDIADFAAMNEVYKKYYQTECPARSAFAVKSLPLGALVEIETIACKNNG